MKSGIENIKKKMNKFYVTGLPRSGTAWLSVYLTTHESFCFHEAGLYGDVNNLMESRKEKYVGNSCPSLIFTPELIDGPLILVRRPVAECHRSVNRLFKTNVVLEANKRINSLKPDLDVKFRDLFRSNTLKDICSCIGIEFDRDRAMLLSKLNIQAQYDPKLIAKYMS